MNGGLLRAFKKGFNKQLFTCMIIKEVQTAQYAYITYALRHNLCIREQHIQAHSTFTIRHFSFLGKEIEDENQLTFVVVFYLL